MTLMELLERHPPERAVSPQHSGLAALLERLAKGAFAVTASFLPEGVALTPSQGEPCLLFTLLDEGRPESLAVSLDAETAATLSERLPELPVITTAPAPEPVGLAPTRLTGELARLFNETERLEPEARAARLMDWIMDRIDATRCALIPFEAGTPGPPLAFHMRGERPIPPRLLPRRVIESVALTRQPLISHDVTDVSSPIAASESVIEQNVRSCMAVPVVFRGDLLAVCYVDRIDQPKRFTGEERASFEAFAYELATPLLSLRDEKRRREFRELRDQRLRAPSEQPQIVTSPALEPVLQLARELARHRDLNILVLGETGSGKEVIARAIHEMSPEAARPFIGVNVAALATELFESELMGSVKGAFTGAVDRPGRAAQADGGTLFLDEIGDLALVNQVKLLRFLQDRRIVPVGGKQERQIDVRVIAATNRDLRTLVRQGDFRADLFHRFAPPLRVPPLRERREEILPHARAWLEHKSKSRGVRLPVLTPDAEEYLLEHPWPGNVRQLEMVMSHAVLLARQGQLDRSTLESLGPVSAPPSQADALHKAGTTLAEWRAARDAQEHAWLGSVLDRHRGNAESAARELGCPGSTLRHLLTKHGLRR